MIGARYCNSPIADSGIRLAAPANSSSGIAVTTPEHDSAVWRGRHGADGRRALRGQQPRYSSGRHGERPRLQQESVRRRHREPLLDQAVQAEAGRQHERDVRARARSRRSAPPTAHGADADGDPLGRAQPLAQHDDAEQHGHQGLMK